MAAVVDSVQWMMPEGVAAALDIPYYVMNFKKEFKENVIDYFIDDYLHGRTPNPCIACNRYVKWESLLKRSLDIGAEYIATGHYARVESCRMEDMQSVILRLRQKIRHMHFITLHRISFRRH